MRLRSCNSAGRANDDPTAAALDGSEADWTIKYRGEVRSNAATLAGSRVSVAEKRSFWHWRELESEHSTHGTGDRF